MEIGILVALASAFASSVRESIRKHVSRDFSSVEIGFLTQVYGTVILAPFAAWHVFNTGFSLSPGLVISILFSAASVLSTTYIYVEAMRISDLSVTEPLRQTAPLMVALIEPLILGTDFSLVVVSAALLGAAGAYILMSDKGLKQPVKNLQNRGAFMALGVAAIFAFLAIAKRFGSTNMEPLLFTYFTYVLGLAGFWIWKRKKGEKIPRDNYLRLDVFGMGAVTAIGAVLTIYAFSLISASEATIVKQSSAVFGVLIGGRFFREDGILRKLLGSLIIISGVALVSLI